MTQQPPPSDKLARLLLDALPQTQCTRCGYPSCADYAQAIAQGEADINQCPPGGQEGVRRLAAISGRAEQPLNSAFGQEGPRSVAWIDEDWCIGCTLCIKACPVECIVGSNKLMHTIIEAECTGCELCVPACPVDCIHMENITGDRSGWDAWSLEQATDARQRHAATQARRQGHRATLDTPSSTAASTSPAVAAPNPEAEAERKRARIAAALARARQQQPR